MQACYAFSPLQWLYSVGAEVFALNNLTASILLLLCATYAAKPTHGVVIVGALFCGVSLGNQHTMVLFEIPAISWILYTRRQVCGCVCVCVCVHIRTLLMDVFTP